MLYSLDWFTGKIQQETPMTSSVKTVVSGSGFPLNQSNDRWNVSGSPGARAVHAEQRGLHHCQWLRGAQGRGQCLGRKWWFPFRHDGVPWVIIHFNGAFNYKPTILDTPIYGNHQISRWKAENKSSEMVVLTMKNGKPWRMGGKPGEIIGKTWKNIGKSWETGGKKPVKSLPSIGDFWIRHVRCCPWRCSASFIQISWWYYPNQHIFTKTLLGICLSLKISFSLTSLISTPNCHVGGTPDAFIP